MIVLFSWLQTLAINSNSSHSYPSWTQSPSTIFSNKVVSAPRSQVRDSVTLAGTTPRFCVVLHNNKYHPGARGRVSSYESIILTRFKNHGCYGSVDGSGWLFVNSYESFDLQKTVFYFWQIIHESPILTRKLEIQIKISEFKLDLSSLKSTCFRDLSRNGVLFCSSWE